MGDFHETFLYHYTNEKAYRKILRLKTLLKSCGVYLTTLQPETGRGQQECYFKFNKRDLPGVKYVAMNGDRDVWRFPNDINLNKISFYHGYTVESEYETYQQNNSSTTYAEKPERSFGCSCENDVYGFKSGTAAVLIIGAAALSLFMWK